MSVDAINQIAAHNMLRRPRHSSQLSSSKTFHSSLNTIRWPTFLPLLSLMSIIKPLHGCNTPTSPNMTSNDWPNSESPLPPTPIHRSLYSSTTSAWLSDVEWLRSIGQFQSSCSERWKVGWTRRNWRRYCPTWTLLLYVTQPIWPCIVLTIYGLIFTSLFLRSDHNSPSSRVHRRRSIASHVSFVPYLLYPHLLLWSANLTALFLAV